MKKSILFLSVTILLCGSMLFPLVAYATSNAQLQEAINRDESNIYYNVERTQLCVGDVLDINAYVLPIDATVQKISYRTSNPLVLSVDDNGKVHALQEGNAIVTLSVNDMEKEIVFTVEDSVLVSEIEVNGFRGVLEVNEQLRLNINYYPEGADCKDVIFESSNVDVATISDNGLIQGISEGYTEITIRVGTVIKKLDLKVYVKTDSIFVEDNFLVMQPGEKYKLNVEISPKNATQNIKYRSTNDQVIKVNESGIVSAVKSGCATIIISNENSLQSIVIIVNETTDMHSSFDKKMNNDVSDNMEKDLFNEALVLEDEIHIELDSGSIINKDMLNYIYETKKVLLINTEDIQYRIDGSLLKNMENEIRLFVDFSETKEGLVFHINNEVDLPGPIEITFLNIDSKYNCMYFFNQNEGKHELLNSFDGNKIVVSDNGTYLLTEDKLKNYTNVTIYIFGAFLALGVVILVYILLRKRYWFW